MASATFDRFDGGLLLARPSSTAPANSLSRALNLDPQPGGWMRSRPSWRRTPNATLISNQFKGLESNGGNLWVFGVGDATQVTGATINSSQTTGLSSIFYAFHTVGTQNPQNSIFNGSTKWGSGFLAAFSGIDPLASFSYQFADLSIAPSPRNCVYFDGNYLFHGDNNILYKSSDGLNFSAAKTFSTDRRILTINVTRSFGVDYLYVGLRGIATPANKYQLVANSMVDLAAQSEVFYSNSLTKIMTLRIDVSGTLDITSSGIYLNNSLVRAGFHGAAAQKGGVICAGALSGGIRTSSDGGVTWTDRTSGVSYDIERIITHGGLFVASGLGSLITSPDGINWTPRTPVNCRGIASSGSMVWAGGINGAAWKSLDAITWTQQDHQYTDVRDAAYGAAGFCSVGHQSSFTGVVTLATFGGNFRILYQRSGASSVTSTNVTDPAMPNSGLMVTASSRIFAISDDGQVVRYCALAAPTNWSTGDAGFLPVAQHFGSGQRAYALGIYQGKLVVFTDTSIQIWKLDPDPTAIALENTIEGVGTRHHSSIVSLQGDLLFESDSGVRSLTTLQNSLYPTDTDVGLPIKKITPSPSQLVRIGRFGQASSCIGLAATPFAQYWVAAPDLWDVDPGSGVKYGWASWSYSRQAKLNAWSVHSAAAKISAWTTLGSTVFARTDGDDYLMQMQPEVFGVEQVGSASAPYTAEMDTQWLDFKKPGVRKVLTGMDFDGQNVASVAIYSSLGGNREGVLMDTIAVNSNQAGWTYSGEIIPVQADGTEFKLRFVGVDGADVQVNRMTLYYDEVGLA